MTVQTYSVQLDITVTVSVDTEQDVGDEGAYNLVMQEVGAIVPWEELNSSTVWDAAGNEIV